MEINKKINEDFFNRNRINILESEGNKNFIKIRKNKVIKPAAEAERKKIIVEPIVINISWILGIYKSP